MTRPTDPLFDERVAAWLDGDPDRAPGDALELVLTTFPSVAQQRAVHRMPRRLPTMSMPTRVAAAAIIGVLAFGGAVYVARQDQPAVGGPTATPNASLRPSQPAVVASGATPSPTPTPILWTQASLKEDWPAPVRAEPAGGASVEPIQGPHGGDPEACCRKADPVGDTGSDAHPWVDIREVVLSGSFRVGMTLVSDRPPVVPPTEQWIAYGVVVDDDGDGVPDRRIGDENITNAAGELDNRVWTTDLHTGLTTVGWHSGTIRDSYYPPGIWTDADFLFGGNVTGGGTVGSLPERFYVWASVIQDGRVVATDYAPDVGWLAPTFTPQVETTPRPGPTPQVKDDPHVPGGRLWTVTVVNNSPKPATLFVAEDDGSGAMGRLVGTVTPSVVPAGATMKVTFALPPEDSIGWAIFVNPGPKQGGLNWQDVPAYGEYRIQADGTSGWRSLVP
jgi:hypothetical protein